MKYSEGKRNSSKCDFFCGIDLDVCKYIVDFETLFAYLPNMRKTTVVLQLLLLLFVGAQAGNQKQPVGVYKTAADLTGISSGIYLCRFSVNGRTNLLQASF